MNEYGIYHFEETSAKNGSNIEDIFKKAINVIYSGYLKYIEDNCINGKSKKTTFHTGSIYDSSVNSFDSIKLRKDHNRINDNKESDETENKFCLC